MDSYEEGELLIEGRPTSHFLEPERERYREEYISFIFQDYNILDSFTVLQNVELALMSIEDPVKRRARAVELLNRVGLGDKLRQRGSKLSGGQKQRTVIARALAKDSPIILADEPTGNLDSESAKEIMALLKEVSKDRLLIVVTHNIDEVAGYATREVRIFDGAVVSDTKIASAGAAPANEAAATAETPGAESTALTAPAPKAAKSHIIRNGLALGRAMFSATPKLSIFLCLLMLLGSLGLLAITGRCGKIPELLGTPTMFAPTEGRLVVTKSDGTPLSDKEVDRLADDTGAVRTLHYDYLLDAFRGDFETNTYLSERDEYYSLQPVYGKHFKEKIYGREPGEENEALLYLPVSWKPVFGSGDNFVRRIAWCGLEFDVVGVQYFLDNNQSAKILLTEDGFACAMAAMLLDDAEVSVTLGFMKNGSMNSFQTLDTVLPSFEMPKNSVYVSSKAWNEALDARTEAGSIPAAQVSLSAYFRLNNSFLSEFIGGRQQAFRAGDSFEGDIYLRKAPEGLGEHTAAYAHDRTFLAVNADVLRLAVEQQLAAVYPQASLFYTSEEKARTAAEKLRTDGYVSALSTAKYSPEVYETVLSSAEGIMLLVMWVLTVIFLAFFINLCSGKAVGAFRHDLAILRSMGIPVKTVVSGLFARLFLSLIPSVIFVMLLAFVLYRTPAFNAAFPYLYWWQYLLIFLGMALMAVRVGYKQVKKLFGRSVRETLRGGDDV